MNYIEFVEGCDPLQMRISTCQKPLLKEDQVLIKVAAFGINRADTLQRQGKYPAPKGESPILGLEVSGVICGIGDKVEGWSLAEPVFGLVAGGGYAEYVAVNCQHIMPVPKGLELREAAGIAEVFLTAYQSLVCIGELQNNSNVLIHAGASGVGLAAIQLAKLLNCAVATTCSSAQKLEICKKYGAKVLINYLEQDFSEIIKNQLGKVDLVIDFIGGDYLNRNLKVLNTDGTIVYLAMLSGRYADKLDMALLLAKRAKICGSTLRSRSDSYKTKLIEGFSEQFLSEFAANRLTANIDTYYSASDIAIAHQRLEKNQTQGKLICSW